MSGAPVMVPGVLVAERYCLDAPIVDRSPAAISGRSASKIGQLWHARDDLLARSVAVLLVPDDDPLAEPVLAGARAVAGLGHPMLANVYDAGRSPGFAFVVTEYFEGASLDQQLRTGPLDPTAAVDLVAEIAGALAAAHALGVYGLTPAPSRILFTTSGLPRLASVALAEPSETAVPIDLTDPVDTAAPIDTAADRAARSDTVALAELLYAALTSRWPGPADLSGLPSAPQVEGHLCSPRQVRGGVPRELDDVVAFTLGTGDPRRHTTQIASPAALFAALAPFRSKPEAGHPFGADTAIIPEVDGRHVPTALPGDPRTPFLNRRRRKRLGIAIGIIVLAVAIAGLVWQGPAIRPHFVTHSDKGATSTQGEAADDNLAHVVAVKSIAEFDPYGDHTDPHVAEAPLAVDGNASTAWRTQTFTSASLGNLKPGVGLLVDLGQARAIRGVRLIVLGNGTSLSLLASDGTRPPTSETAMTVVAQAVDAGTHVTLHPSAGTTPFTARYWLVWLTKLPADGAGFHGGVAEITFES